MRTWIFHRAQTKAAGCLHDAREHHIPLVSLSSFFNHEVISPLVVRNRRPGSPLPYTRFTLV